MKYLPREKLLSQGVESLLDEELVAILLRTGVKGLPVLELAKTILKKHPVDSMGETQTQDLLKIRGLETAKICSLLAGIELGRRVCRQFPKPLPLISSPQEALVHLDFIRNKKREYFVVLYLNARHQLIFKQTVSIGTLDSSLIHPREVFAPAVSKHASGCLLAHNHPSGDINPSAHDKQTTSRLVKAGEILGIQILDHLIVTQTSHISMKERGEF